MTVIKAVSVAVLCASGLVAIVALDAGTSASPPTAEARPEQTTTVGRAFSADTLTAADRLDIAYHGNVVAMEPTAPAAKAPDEMPPQPPAPTRPPKIESKRAPDTKARKPASVLAGGGIKDKAPKKIRNPDRGKVAVEPRTCRRPEGFAALLQALKLAPECAT
ncbi:hypothetical protein ACFFWD_13955 [Bradyrhizobium erythrophlei]|uniref:hypothetical protein n=1 Tax=Bradyrhizobium erythrophlei TaxID=1437360 RepID=UPI0035EF63F1